MPTMDKNHKLHADAGNSNGGQFIKKDGSGSSGNKSEDRVKSNGNNLSDGATPAEEKRLKELGYGDRLSKSDWKRIYSRLGEIRIGGFCHKTKKGEKYIVLTKLNEDDIPKIVTVGGTFSKPKIKDVLEFQSEEDMFEKLEEIKWR